VYHHGRRPELWHRPPALSHLLLSRPMPIAHLRVLPKGQSYGSACAASSDPPRVVA